MSQFHSSLSRRDFMKALGLTAVGAAALTAPTFKDLDEVISSPEGKLNRAWWIKDRELENPTVELDWSQMKRSDGKWTGQDASCQTYFMGADEQKKRSAQATAYTAEKLKANAPGMNLRDTALSSGIYQAPISYMGLQTSKTPAQLGVPKWSGTPEENAKMMRAAARFYGMATVGFAEISQQYKDKLVREYDKAASHKKYIFEDVAVGYEGTDKLVLPASVPLYDMAFLHPLSKEMYRTWPSSNIGGAGNSIRYSQWSIIQPRLQQFARTLGYQIYGYTTPVCGAIPTIATNTLTGTVEGGRNNGVCISPEYGSTVGAFSVVMDIPVAPTPPIDAGIWRFCQTCHKCSEACPTGSIPDDKEPRWDIPQIYGKADNTHVPGKKQFWTDGVSCWSLKATFGGCGQCMGICTFNTGAAGIHSYVKATLASTPMFNDFLWRADKWWGYGAHEDKENWWNLTQPSLGFDTTVGVTHSTY
ncbi:reductive dehalogenase [Dehalogenimonas etheniformans]|uniref:Reductive dehalogenase n=1 Tax=Dehalogenimonas etheniformans TaxID=1536648 RepID=A0A2P5P535_9CHLR|nr:reductive dehalogenase [Dehalogenimonas etheniformans]PPD57396.1 reductive dehalogenase [Dehalogenimonas etheniformans]QNT75247.1 reductive dehalogenase [Dehalogenimonas etheniformans]